LDDNDDLGKCVELLESFDAAPIYPEVNALQLAIRHQPLEPILLAEELGCAADNCAYVKADIGAYLRARSLIMSAEARMSKKYCGHLRLARGSGSATAETGRRWRPLVFIGGGETQRG